MDNMVVFVTKGRGGDLIKTGDPQLKKGRRQSEIRREELKLRGLNLAKATGCLGQLKWCMCKLPLSYPPFLKANIQALIRTEYEPDIKRLKENVRTERLPYK